MTAVETRQRILDAARQVIIDRGLVRATTREIARAAGVSEGTLYNHYSSKEAIFLAALSQLPSGFFSLVRGLPGRAGSGSVRGNLAELALAGIDFYGEAIPMGASIFADPSLLRRHRELLAEHGAGPQRANEAVAAYLRAEQKLGRIRLDVDPDALAYLLLGALYQRVYWREFLGHDADRHGDEQFVERVLDTLARTLFPAATGDTIPPP